VEHDAKTAAVIRFGVFEIDSQAGELHKSGRKIRLQEQPFQILLMLVERSGGVVTHDELRQKLWPTGTFVDFDHGIRAAINKIREALGDSAENPRFVETIPRHGYRFIAPVQPIAPVSSVRRLPARALVLSLGGVLALIALTVGLNVGGLRDRLGAFAGERHATPLPKIESIAVLPLENLSHDAEQEYFADGMTEALITNLGKIHALRVTSRTTVMHYKGTTKTLPEIARELNVDAVLEGTVLWSGDRVRVTANLLHAPTDRHLWADTYESQMRDVLGLQAEVARAIAEQVNVQLNREERAHLETTRSVNPVAQVAYLKGRYFMSRWPAAEFAKCEQYFSSAIQSDPSFGEAHAALAFCYSMMSWFQPPKLIFPKVKSAALKSLQIDNTLSEGHLALANAKMFFDWEWADAEEEARLAIDLNPSNALAHACYSNVFLFRGQFLQAIVEARKAVELDPASLLVNRNLTFVYLMARQYNDAIAQSKITLELNPANFISQFDLARAYLLKGSQTQARAEAARFGFAEHPFFASPAKHKDSVERLGRDISLQSASSKEYLDPFYVSMLYAHLGVKERAFEWLTKAYQDKSAMMVQLKVNPNMDPLRSDPRFQDVLRRMNFPR
jgi:TolB-like protein/DNA-binding winged helix-turn-helix (wHTH) protein/Tfp pilus assembly protein PilF